MNAWNPHSRRVNEHLYKLTLERCRVADHASRGLTRCPQGPTFIRINSVG